MLVDNSSELMSDLLFTVHQHGGDDVKWKPPILDSFSWRLENLPGIAWTTTARGGRSCSHTSNSVARLAERVWCTSVLTPNVWRKTYPICDAPLSARSNFAPSQKSRGHNRSCVWTEAPLSGMIFAMVQKLYRNSVNILSVCDLARTISSYIEVYYNNTKLLSFSFGLFASKVNIKIQPKRSSNHVCF